jgi:hypothetical protein
MSKVICSLLLTAAFASQSRDNPRVPTGTAVLTGVVVIDEQNGQPIRRALVTATINGDTRQQSQTATDDRGRFMLAALPAGTVRLVVSKPGFVTTYYGATQPGSTVGRPIALVNDQKVDVSIRLPRGAVITGTVTDQSGQPMAGVGVRVQRVATSATGQRVFVSTTGPVIPSTDDRGEFRVFGLAAGNYIVMAQPRLPGPIMGGSEVRPTTDAEVRWAEQQMRVAGGAAAASTATESLPRAQAMAFANVYYPNTTSAAAAGIVTVTAGQERRGIDLRMQFVPTARVEGTVTAIDGTPARGVQVTLIPEAEAANLEAERFMMLMEVGLAAGNMSPTGADGTFSLQGVEPGGYVVLARTTPPGRAGGPAALGWAMTDVRVDGRDITGLALRLAPGQSISGRVIFEGKATPPTQVSVSLRPVGARGLGVTGQRPVEGPERAFIVEGLIPSPYRISATAAGWTLKSAVIDGRDAADAPFEVRPGANITDAVLTFTDAPAEVSGVLYDAAGRANGDMSIVLFSTNPAHWFTGSRRVRPAARPATDGRFTFTGLVAGDYYLAALTDVTPADLNSPQFLELVMPAAVKITVADGEKKVQDLRVK